jgi:hypothetical protein
MASRGRALPVFQNVQFRDCIHREVAGPTAEAVVAAVRGGHCAPGAAPVEAGSLFHGVAQALGEAAFRALWSEFQKPTGKANPLDFADFLAAREPGRALPQLADLARFDLAYALAAQPGAAPSVAPCCLSGETMRRHPRMKLRFQPNWRHVALNWPVHRLLGETLTPDLLAAF